MQTYKMTYRDIDGDGELDWVRGEVSEAGGQSSVGSHFISGKLILFVNVQDYNKFCGNYKEMESFRFMESCEYCESADSKKEVNK